MGHVLTNSGGGGTTSDDCTAYKSHVLEGKSAVTVDSNDEPGWGTIPDFTGRPTEIQNYRWNNNRCEFAVPRGYYECYWDGNSYEYVPAATMASWLNINSGMIRAGYSILNVPGDAWVVWTGDTNIDTNKVISGYTYWSNGQKFTGTMPNRGDYWGWGNDTGNNTDGQYCYIRIPWGYYNNNALVALGWSNIANMVGLNSSVIKKGVRIMGITGSFEGYVPISTDLYLRGNNTNGFVNNPLLNYKNVSFEAGQITILLGFSMIRGNFSIVGYSRLNVEIYVDNLRSSGTSSPTIHLNYNDPSVNGMICYTSGQRKTGQQIISLDISSSNVSGTMYIETGNFGGKIYRIWLS